MDKFTKQKRSQIMARIKGRGTSPEKSIRSCLRRLRIRFRGNVASLPGTPDFVIQGQKKVVFVHGCFWHGHKECRRSVRPETNRPFWDRKIDGNIVRDKRNLRDSKKEGWKVLIIWQCQIKEENKLMKRLL
jgi:DNA mismatch endonuclease, patch repair protein